MAAPRILIVGGVAGGASAATRARRMNEAAEIVVFEKGGYASFANCGLPYHIGGQIAARDKLLVSHADEFRSKFNIAVRTQTEVLRIDRAQQRVEVCDLRSGEHTWERYDKLILAPGATPVVPPWSGASAPNVFVLRDLADMDRIKARLEGGGAQRAVVVGAGFIGLEMVEALVTRGLQVAVVELAPQVLPPLDPELAREIEAVLRARGVALHVGVAVEDLQLAGSQVTGVRLRGGEVLPADFVLLSIGVRPNVQLAADAGLKIGASGAIAVNEFLQTSDPAIYAVGDAAEVQHAVLDRPVRIPLAGPANRNGRLAGEHAATGRAARATPVTATAIVGVFETVAAMTGLSEKAARQADLPVATAYALRAHHAGYYPGAQSMILKLVYEPQSRRLLGAQAVGGAGVDKRIDVAATVLHFGGTIDDLAGLDLAYAPQFGAAKDPLHIAAFGAANQADGLVRSVAPGTPWPAGQLLDVRTPPEVARGALPGAVNIPLHELRARLGELDRVRPVIVYCQVGQRGYNAARILVQSGFGEVYNLAGGYRMHAAR
jgi:NADPH-dependent 2,4-dienoyl-CoA reductase/sulfur reductase-like enzyme/rhodanese-related sulfurtransferase